MAPEAELNWLQRPFLTEKMNTWSLTARMDAFIRDSQQVLVPTPPFPRGLMLELSNACNHACLFCANPKMSRKRRPMDRALGFSTLEQGYELGAREVGFYTTGDPFVHTGLAEFVGHAKELGYEYTYISTNGALATPIRLKQVVDAGIDSIKFSINAGSRETYRVVHGKDDWDKVVANLRYVANYRKQLDHDVRLSITFVVIDLTRPEVDSFRAEFSEFVDDVFFHDANNQQGYMPEVRDVIATGTSDVTYTPAKAPCYMVFNRAHVTCEGFLTLCCVDFQNYLAVADLTQVSLREAWESPDFVKMRERHLRNDLVGTLCFNCILGQNEHIEPLVPAFSATFDSKESAEENLEKQRSRLTRAAFISGRR